MRQDLGMRASSLEVSPAAKLRPRAPEVTSLPDGFRPCGTAQAYRPSARDHLREFPAREHGRFPRPWRHGPDGERTQVRRAGGRRGAAAQARDKAAAALSRRAPTAGPTAGDGAGRAGRRYGRGARRRRAADAGECDTCPSIARAIPRA